MMLFLLHHGMLTHAFSLTSEMQSAHTLQHHQSLEAKAPPICNAACIPKASEHVTFVTLHALLLGAKSEDATLMTSPPLHEPLACSDCQ
jgi:hypothetical protein